jgi:hypothetical protein
MILKNQGFIWNKLAPEDWLLGDLPEEHPVLCKDGNWTKWLVEKEYQSSKYLRTSACVSYSKLNQIEMLFKRLYGIEINFSDRFTAKQSGTKQGYGNTGKKVADSVRKDGLILEEYYGWDKDKVRTGDEYYKTIPESLQVRAKGILNNFNFNYWYVWERKEEDQRVSLMRALRYCPVQVFIKAYGPLRKGVYQRISGGSNHAVLLFNYKEGEWWEIYDHYDAVVKRLAWNYRITSGQIATVDERVYAVKREKGVKIDGKIQPPVEYRQIYKESPFTLTGPYISNYLINKRGYVKTIPRYDY